MNKLSRNFIFQYLLSTMDKLLPIEPRIQIGIFELQTFDTMNVTIEQLAEKVSTATEITVCDEYYRYKLPDNRSVRVKVKALQNFGTAYINWKYTSQPSTIVSEFSNCLSVYDH